MPQPGRLNPGRKVRETMSKRELFDFIVQEGIATENELELVSNLNGYNEETLNDVIWVRTGYHSKEQYEYCELGIEQ